MAIQKIDPATLASIEAGIAKAAQVATMVAPEYGGFVVLGQAVAQAAPELYNDVVALINKDKPTPEDNAALAASIASLLNPETL